MKDEYVFIAMALVLGWFVMKEYEKSLESWAMPQSDIPYGEKVES